MGVFKSNKEIRNFPADSFFAQIVNTINIIFINIQTVAGIALNNKKTKILLPKLIKFYLTGLLKSPYIAFNLSYLLIKF